MPRAALLSIHARVEGTEPSTWEDPSLVQLWGPRYSAYVVAARDLPVFSLGRLPDDAGARRIAVDLAARLAQLGGGRMTYGEAGEALGEHPNRLRYAAPTGTVLIRWDGARLPIVWTVPSSEVDPRDARLELARRYLHTFGPATPQAFAQWAGIGQPRGRAAFDTLRRSLTPVRTPVGDAWILTRDEPPFRAAPRGPWRRHGSCRAAMPTSSSRDTIANSWSATPIAGASSGPRACGRVPSSSRASSLGPGGARRAR
ncbi:MAG: winged helix DNA-binding domain-containing protein [Actinomycetota bacterium]|nr:winged helix DNA-binding domain-containing protein [Actinomycetota bacterium]